MLKDELTIVFCTCDAFSDLWEGFFKQLKKYWPECDCKIILNTESIPFHYEDLNISTPMCCAKDTPWSLRLKMALDRVETNKVLLFLDDFYLKSNVDTEEIERCINKMNMDTNVKSIVFAWQPGNNKDIGDEMLEKRARFATYRVNAQVAIWDKKYLREILREKESAWEYEVNGSFRSIFKKGKLLSLKKGKPLVFNYDFGFLMIKGKYNEDLVNYFEKYEGINFDLKNREKFIPSDEVKIKMINKVEKMLKYFSRAILSFFEK